MDNQYLDWYKKNYKADYSGDLTRLEGMSDKDWSVGQNLYGAYLGGQQLNKQLQAGQQALATEKQQSLETASIQNQMLMKYLPTYNKALGLGGSGTTETGAIQAYNNYMNRVSGIQGDIGNRQQQMLDSYGTKRLDLQQATADREGDLLRYYGQIEQEQEAKRREEETAKKQSLAALEEDIIRGGATDKISLDRYLKSEDIEQTDYDRLLDLYRGQNTGRFKEIIDSALISENTEEDTKNVFLEIERQKKEGDLTEENAQDTYAYYYEKIIPDNTNIEDLIQSIKDDKSKLGSKYERILAQAEARKKEIEKQKQIDKAKKDNRFAGAGQTANPTSGMSFKEWVQEALRNTKPQGY